MEKHIQLSIIVLVAINTMDSIMGAVVGPTMVFYFTELGGSIDQYGYMGSITSIAAIVMTSFYGKWLDMSGNKFRVGYMVSFIAGITSYMMYFTASLLPTGENSVAVYYLMCSRLIEGLAGKIFVVVFTCHPFQSHHIPLYTLRAKNEWKVNRTDTHTHTHTYTCGHPLFTF